MFRGYRNIILAGVLGGSFSANAASVPFDEYPNNHFPQDKFPMEHFPAIARPDIEHSINAGAGLSMAGADLSDESSEDHEDGEHENNSSHGFKGMFGRSGHDGVAHPNPNFPYDKFPFGEFPNRDFPGKHFPDKFDRHPSGWGEYALTPVPVPAAIWLFGSGLIGLVAISRRKEIKE
ncbi:MAG: VPLPA-CTERM sorting domain-containing protein [Gammaproteobacteria bacterium]|nr:VPLPA-CTERM sorting domain-containing protein [Gammaproteobacteria bacterium]MDH5593489.1 VPLPA-CTERM sorting domain-containing protein [Gammaproteobacteria bacterium]MDH5614148.1 VPLPA-CTERM sorting domain-containing protein [Gammaproteobacteria bacterium]